MPTTILLILGFVQAIYVFDTGSWQVDIKPTPNGILPGLFEGENFQPLTNPDNNNCYCYDYLVHGSPGPLLSILAPSTCPEFNPTTVEN